MKRKLGKMLAAIISLALLFQVNVFAQEPHEVEGKVTVTITPDQELTNLKAGDSFTLTVKLENTLDQLIDGVHHLTLRETIDKNQSVQLCNIPETGNENVKEEGSTIVNNVNLQSISLKNLAAKQTVDVKVDCTVPENMEGKDIGINAALLIDDGNHTVLGSASTTISVASDTTPDDPAPAITITDIQFPDAASDSLKENQEFQVIVTLKNTGNTPHPYVHFGVGISNDNAADFSTVTDFGTLVPQTGIQVDADGIPYVENMAVGESLTFTFKGKLPIGINVKKPWLAVAAVATDGLTQWEEEIPLCTDTKWLQLTVAEDNVKPGPNENNNENPANPKPDVDNTDTSVSGNKLQPASVKKAARTGDESNITFLLTLMVLSGAVVVYGRKKIKQY